jgi:hypothetical protein
MIAIERVALPDFGGESVQPQLPWETHRARLKAAVDRMTTAGLDCLLVYADREHFANISYLTGVDPRFEEELLLLDRHGNGLFLAGNECMGYLPDERLGLKVELFQDLSLMGQQRDRSRPLREIFSSFGIRRGTSVGCVGWKMYDSRLSGDARFASDLPAYLIDLLRDLTGDASGVTNAVDLFTNPVNGLRVVNVEPEQIALFEYAQVQTSRSMLAAMRQLKPGVREDEIERCLDSAGLPLSCHRTIGFGEKARRGMESPRSNRASLGDVYKMGFGVIGSLTARNGCIAHDASELPDAIRDFYGRFAANYFDVVAAWYQTLRVGVSGGEVFAAVEVKRDKRLFDFLVNPGHYIHLDEWLHSPFSRDSQIRIASGTVIQMDVIPVSKGPFVKSNMEDGVVLADEGLRAALAVKYPAMWQRMQARRAFMADSIGIRLHESVLPMSNIPAYLPPYVMSIDRVFVNK